MAVRGGISAWTERLRRRVSPHRRESGFTLLEVLVALAILGMSLSVLLGVFTMALDRTRSDQKKGASELLAKALLNETETIAPEDLRDRHGIAAQDLAWSIKVSPYGSPEDRQAWQNWPVQILVRVEWQDHGRARTLSLSTLRIAPEPGHG
jgi:general secretion pathway protein I